MKIIKQFYIALVAALMSFGVQARQYQATITDSQWQFSGNRAACFLTHSIAQYGIGVFEQKSGEPVRFILTSKSYVPPIQTAMLSSVPPVWMHDVPSLELGAVKADLHKVVVDSALSERMLQELSNGHFQQFSYQSKRAGSKINVVVSSVNFLDGMVQFESCRQELLPFSRKDVYHQWSLFDSLSSAISHKNKRLLTKAVTYIKEAGDAGRIDLIRGTDGFSVKDGRRVYDKRIQAIRAYLIEQGVSAEQVVALDDPEEVDTPEGSVRVKVAGPEPFSHLYFRSGSISLNKRDNSKLDYLLEYMRLQKPDGTLVLKGYSDSEGPRQANLAVSKKRLNAVKKYLISHGVKEDRIVTKAYGESRPTATNRYPTGRQLNRRVDISISG